MSKAIYLIDDAGKLVKHKKVYETNGDGVFKEIKKGYVVDEDHINRLFFSAGPSVMYTGEHTIEQIVIDGATYNLLTMIKSGILIIEGGKVKVWLCGGGTGGEGGGVGRLDDSQVNHYYEGSGMGGPGGYAIADNLDAGVYAVTIGAGGKGGKGSETEIDRKPVTGNATTIVATDGSKSLTAHGGELETGGTGGGGAMRNPIKDGIYTADPYTGDGISKLPFDVMDAHCAGGAGGSCWPYSANAPYTGGGNGGTNGGDGHGGEIAIGMDKHPDDFRSIGGVRGGGNGGYAKQSGGNATYPGGGGGGAGTGDSDGLPNGGDGYQGIAYVLWNDDNVLLDWELFCFIQQPVGGVTPCAMTVEAVGGDDITYQWQEYSIIGGWSDIPGATSNTYSGTTSYTITEYRCKATDATGAEIYSNAATVTKR